MTADSHSRYPVIGDRIPVFLQNWDAPAVIGAWKDDDEITGIFNEIDRERHADLGEIINFDDLN